MTGSENIFEMVHSYGLWQQGTRQTGKNPSNISNRFFHLPTTCIRKLRNSPNDCM